MQINTNDLAEAALDWAVTLIETRRQEAEGQRIDEGLMCRVLRGEHKDPYSSDWACGGPLIDRERFAFTVDEDMETVRAYYPFKQGHEDGSGSDHLVAAMRCYVASELGNVVEVPDLEALFA